MRGGSKRERSSDRLYAAVTSPVSTGPVNRIYSVSTRVYPDAAQLIERHGNAVERVATSYT